MTNAGVTASVDIPTAATTPTVVDPAVIAPELQAAQATLNATFDQLVVPTYERERLPDSTCHIFSSLSAHFISAPAF